MADVFAMVSYAAPQKTWCPPLMLLRSPSAKECFCRSTYDKAGVERGPQKGGSGRAGAHTTRRVWREGLKRRVWESRSTYDKAGVERESAGVGERAVFPIRQTWRMLRCRCSREACIRCRRNGQSPKLRRYSEMNKDSEKVYIYIVYIQ